MERFILRNLSVLEVRKQYQIKISNRFPALVNLLDRENINRSWKNIEENIRSSAKENLGLYELKQHQPRFAEECLHFLDQGKQTKMQCLQDPNQCNVFTPNNVRRENSVYFRNNKKDI
jgi:hypothetical protein